MNEFTHMDGNGNAVMVDVSKKVDTKRTAVATGQITMKASVITQIKNNLIKKGDVLSVARIAGIIAMKKTSELIPLCHNIPIYRSRIDFEFIDDTTIQARAECETVGKTGVEMEALTGVHIALLTIYDMCKALDRSMSVNKIRLLEKHGGKSGDYNFNGE